MRDGGYGQDVVHGLAGQPDHEVELDGTPAAIEGQLGAPSDLLVADSLVDGVAQPLRPRLRRKGEATATSARRDCVHQLDREGVDAGARERQEDIGPAPVQLGGDLAYVRVVGRGEARQPNLLIAGRPQNRLGGRDGHVWRALPQRPRLHSRLAEAAAACAAAHDLDLGPVEDDAHVRHELANAMHGGFEVGGDAARDGGRGSVVETVQAVEPAIGAVARAVQRGHVHARDARQGTQDCGPINAPVPLAGFGVQAAVPAERLQDVADLEDHVFALAQHHSIDEIRKRLGIGDDRTPGDDQRIGLVTLDSRKRHSAEVEHFQDVRVAARIRG